MQREGVEVTKHFHVELQSPEMYLSFPRKSKLGVVCDGGSTQEGYTMGQTTGRGEITHAGTLYNNMYNTTQQMGHETGGQTAWLTPSHWLVCAGMYVGK